MVIISLACDPECAGTCDIFGNGTCDSSCVEGSNFISNNFTCGQFQQSNRTTFCRRKTYEGSEEGGMSGTSLPSQTLRNLSPLTPPPAARSRHQSSLPPADKMCYLWSWMLISLWCLRASGTTWQQTSLSPHSQCISFPPQNSDIMLLLIPAWCTLVVAVLMLFYVSISVWQLQARCQ